MFGIFDAGSLAALLEVTAIDLVLAGDNAVVIGLAAAGLDASQRKKAIAVGILAATILRITFASAAFYLLAIVGLLFCWRLVVPVGLLEDVARAPQWPGA